jgi:uncharacterized protein YndB with AHSA1/START domain
MSEEPHEEQAESRSISFEYDLPEPVEKVWRALTTPEIVAEWLLPNDLRAEEGTGFSLHTPDAEPIDCEVIAIEERRSIRLRWRDEEARRGGLDSTVTFEVGATEGGTHLRIVHEVHYAAHPARLPATTCLAANDNCATGLRLAA